METPVIKITGNNNMTLEVFSEYQEQGATAKTVFQNLDSKVKTEGTVDTNKIGTYEITYSVSGPNGTSSVVRFVNVVDTTPPELTLLGDVKVSMCPNEEYEEEGYEAVDNYDGIITDKVTTEKQEYLITYLVKDSSNNETTAERTIVYEDKMNPSIMLKGERELHIKWKEPYVEPGYIVTDNCDELSDQVEVTGTVNTNVKGTYELTYRVKDAIGNEAAVTRKIVVE